MHCGTPPGSGGLPEPFVPFGSPLSQQENPCRPAAVGASGRRVHRGRAVSAGRLIARLRRPLGRGSRRRCDAEQDSTAPARWPTGEKRACISGCMYVCMGKGVGAYVLTRLSSAQRTRVVVFREKKVFTIFPPSKSPVAVRSRRNHANTKLFVITLKPPSRGRRF